jgi:replicative DNA helicase
MLNGYDDWLQAQNCLLGAALINPDLVPRIVSELTAEDFSGNGLLIYKAMADLFRQSRTNDEVDAVAVAHYLGDTAETRGLVANFMGCSPNFSEIERYIAIVRQSSKLSRLRNMGAELSAAVSLDDAEGVADNISAQLMERPGLKGFGPDELLANFEKRHKEPAERIPWKQRRIGDYIRLKKGQFLILGAEPSGGKTAFALEQMWTWSQNKRVLFVSLETDAETIFDRQVSSLAGIPMDALMDGRLEAEHWKKYQRARGEISKRKFKILPAAGLSVAGIKAAAIGFRADIIIIDYLQIIQLPGKRLSRYETITEISMALHILAQSTGMIVIALSQVTNRDPSAKNSPLTIHSARESGQIEADADAILMLDKFVEKKLTESGCRANRILRIVKNKNGRCCNIPLIFDGRTQAFDVAPIPNPEWESIQNNKRTKQNEETGEFEQLPMDTQCPF